MKLMLCTNKCPIGFRCYQHESNHKVLEAGTKVERRKFDCNAKNNYRSYINREGYEFDSRGVSAIRRER